jgi:hypothetical protein
MMFVVAIPSEGDGGKPRRALASLQHFKELYFRTPEGKVGKTPITFVGATTAHNNQERIDEALRLHTILHVDGTDGGGDYCSYCAHHPTYPCETVRILTGAD